MVCLALKIAPPPPPKKKKIKKIELKKKKKIRAARKWRAGGRGQSNDFFFGLTGIVGVFTQRKGDLVHL